MMSLDEACLMVVQNSGFMPVDEGAEVFGNTTARIPLCRKGAGVPGITAHSGRWITQAIMSRSLQGC